MLCRGVCAGADNIMVLLHERKLLHLEQAMCYCLEHHLPCGCYFFSAECMAAVVCRDMTAYFFETTNSYSLFMIAYSFENNDLFL